MVALPWSRERKCRAAPLGLSTNFRYLCCLRMPPRPTVLLFDVDGTLATTTGSGRRAIERVFLARFGHPNVMQGVDFGGMTDRAIARVGLRVVGRPTEGPEADVAIDALLADYLPLLDEELDRAGSLRLHPGVLETLAALAGRPGIAVGLGTGNIRPGARTKLTRLGIFDRFGFGGFGDDDEHRPTLLRIGATRGAAALGVAVAACRVVVIGDTARDVAAARAIQAESVAVGTSGADPAALRASGATHAFETLAAPGVLDALLGG